MSKKELSRICVVIPAYNEASVIGDVITNTKIAFKKANLKATVVVVNDNSSDSTSSVARKAGAMVIDHILNSGAGGATATGLSYEEQNGHDNAVTMDADGQHDPSDVVEGVKRLLASKTDLLIDRKSVNI